jgi:hypothetical protein
MTDHLSRVKSKVRQPPPEDGKCEICRKADHKYIKANVYFCLNCWDRDQYPALCHMTNEELEKYRADNLKKMDDAKVSLVNAKALQDKPVGFHV